MIPKYSVCQNIGAIPSDPKGSDEGVDEVILSFFVWEVEDGGDIAPSRCIR